ncbi:hypothetical protein MUK42_27621 [Musa troglodytarum]|uniref:EIF3F/CSN6-like C-terminal domain-containing protein n=1 Tax=Musa troglodytarum TaxID=320322 RepID=A0A9E7F7V6_9LILI|nr:hypothetical protein MUK42_27621 [Musa troglodytarum]
MIRNDDHLDTRNRSSPAHKQITALPRAELKAVLQFFPPPSSILSARLHPVVLFNICDCYVRCPDQAERVIGTLLGSVSDGTVNDKLPNDLEGMEASTKRLYALIDDIYKYVDDVVEGRAAPDNDIGRFLANALASVLKISATDFDNVFNERIQDNFALIYLSSLIRTQLSIAEKLNTAAQILVLDNNRPDIFNLKVG